MIGSYEEFLKTFNSPNTLKVARSMSAIAGHDYSNVTPVDVENIIINMQPNSLKSITTICYVFGLYARYIGNDDLYNMVHDVNRNSVWVKAKPNAPKKFISHSDFENVYRDIGMYEEYNGFYIQTLFRCLYEGIYSDDMSVVKNLRASDVDGKFVTLRYGDGKEYHFNISDKLSDDLKALGDIDIWERKNRYGTCKINIVGKYSDTCFKAENRKGSSEYSYRFTYYRILRKISKDYIGYNLLPLQIYVSGIMYRIRLKLSEHGISIEDAFSDNNKNRIVGNIISEELRRCGSDTEVRNFREMVQGHIDIFVS